MGTEILYFFVLAPIVLVTFDIVRIVQRRNSIKHALLIVGGGLLLSYMTWSSASSGFPAMQGLVIGFFFYFPTYAVLWAVLTGIGRLIKRGRQEVAT